MFSISDCVEMSSDNILLCYWAGLWSLGQICPIFLYVRFYSIQAAMLLHLGSQAIGSSTVRGAETQVDSSADWTESGGRRVQGRISSSEV